MRPAAVLLVDDEPFVLESLRRLLAAEGFEPLAAADAESGLAILRSRPVDAAVTDLGLPGEDGLTFLRRAREHAPDLPVVVLTGIGTIEKAVAAMKEGALDFLAKPVEPSAFLALLRRAVEHGALVDEVRRLRASVREFVEPTTIVGESDAIRRVLRLVETVASTDARVLLQGESGTGKELVAHAIHAGSRRSGKPFVRVNCAAIPEALFESELFGHRRGAFTGANEDRAGAFAEAHGGTLALDEVGTLSPEGQAKLLRAIDTGEVQRVGEPVRRRIDARVVAITNEDLARRAREGSFREDLFFRLNVVPIVVPPLRERKEDVPLLAAHFLDALARREGIDQKCLGPGAVAVLTRYDWPGNVRELRNTLERAAILEPGPEIPAARLAAILEGGMRGGAPGSPASSPAGAPADDADLRLREKTDALERSLIVEALRRTGRRKKDAAGLLGIDPKNLAYYLRKHDLRGGEDE